MRNIRLTLAYDGTGYVGWQIQPNGISVQATVEAAIERVDGNQAVADRRRPNGRRSSCAGAGGELPDRIDDSPRGFSPQGWGHFYPRDILVLDAEEVPLSFHATHAAQQKPYRYVILNAGAGLSVPAAITRTSIMCRFASRPCTRRQELLGKHDFSGPLNRITPTRPAACTRSSSFR